ncbi:glycosyltransferase [Aliarcobacter cryaerophilus]|uniref:glycosyltransferase n=1 Tax=Aliarcobacter cryaerophilus TaxID=28198 RepID=UPI003DA2ACB0
MIDVSVLMSVYNSENTLSKAIESILNQSFKNFEFIIIDDCSTDKSYEILKEYENKDCRIKLYQNEKNLGLAASLNRGLKLCNSSLVARMDSDDYSYPERLEKQYNYFLNNKNIDVLGTAIALIDSNGIRYNDYFFPTTHEDIVKRLNKSSPFAHPTVMYRKSLIFYVGGYDESLKRAQDYDLWKRLRNNAIYANLDEVLLLYTLSLNKSFKSILYELRVSLKENKLSLIPWIHFLKNLLIYFNLYTPRYLRK